MKFLLTCKLIQEFTPIVIILLVTHVTPVTSIIHYLTNPKHEQIKVVNWQQLFVKFSYWIGGQKSNMGHIMSVDVKGIIDEHY